jgi:hypothetical protein
MSHALCRYMYSNPLLKLDPNIFIVGPAATSKFPALTASYLKQRQDERLYRIFYPLKGVDPAILFEAASNPWRFTPCPAATRPAGK